MILPSDEADIVAGKDTLLLRYPWIVPSSIPFLQSIVSSGTKILEFGCGGSTLFFEDLGAEVTSYDSNVEWVENVRSHAKSAKIFHISEYNPLEILNGTFDILSVDSNPDDTDRLAVLSNSILKLKSTGYLLLDNYFSFGMENFNYPENIEMFTFDHPQWCGNGTRVVKFK